jgi:hypothetical protein
MEVTQLPNIKNQLLDKITKTSDITRLQIHVLLDYSDFYKKFTDSSNKDEYINKLIANYNVETPEMPINMFNFSFRDKPSNLLLDRNITVAELNTILSELNSKQLSVGGSRKSKRSLPTNKKHKTEKKKN